MKIVLDDHSMHLRFAPLTLTRPLGNVRMGILTNDERWKTYLPDAEIGYVTEAYLSPRFPGFESPNLSVNAQVIPNEDLVAALLGLREGDMLFMDELWLGSNENGGGSHVHYTGEKPVIISERWHIYQKNGQVLEQDFHLLTAGKKSQPLSKTNTLIGDASRLFIEEGASVEAAVINTKDGVVYIGKDAEIMEGSLVRGPLAMCEHSALKLGTKVYGPTTLGPHCKVGGEVNNVVFQAYSNKGHDGFLGNALIGEWCNLGADTNTSNLKNNYAVVSTYSFETQKEEKTDALFMGVCMGDHSKCGINTMFNTATVIGVSTNVFGAGFPDKYVPSFRWGGGNDFVPFKFDKALEYANNMMARRGCELSADEISILKYIADN
jgi:UDP-N-acetylglucosamine diphosphorylase/glucosamine-1-phosphate N-acetyltransferase